MKNRAKKQASKRTAKAKEKKVGATRRHAWKAIRKGAVTMECTACKVRRKGRDYLAPGEKTWSTIKPLCLPRVADKVVAEPAKPPVLPW